MSDDCHVLFADLIAAAAEVVALPEEVAAAEVAVEEDSAR